MAKTVQCRPVHAASQTHLDDTHSPLRPQSRALLHIAADDEDGDGVSCEDDEDDGIVVIRQYAMILNTNTIAMVGGTTYFVVMMTKSCICEMPEICYYRTVSVATGIARASSLRVRPWGWRWRWQMGMVIGMGNGDGDGMRSRSGQWRPQYSTVSPKPTARCHQPTVSGQCRSGRGRITTAQVTQCRCVCVCVKHNKQISQSQCCRLQSTYNSEIHQNGQTNIIYWCYACFSSYFLDESKETHEFSQDSRTKPD